MKKITLFVLLVVASIGANAQTTPCNSNQLPINLQNGLVGYYPFCGNANDGSSNGNNGTVYGATLTNDRFGNPNSAYSFNGTTDSISVPNSTSLAFSTNIISIAYWVKEATDTSTGNSQILISKQNGSGATQVGFNVYQLDVSNSGMLVGNNNSNPAGPINTTPTLNQWHHLAVVFDNGNCYGYYDGVLTNSTTTSCTLGLNTRNLLFGAANWVYANTFSYNGILDDIMIYDRALSANEISQIYSLTNCVPDITTGLVAKYDFTGNANDSSGNNNNGTVYGATLTTDRFGNPNAAYLFNGTSDYIDIPNSSSLSFPGDSISIEFWGKILSAPISGNDAVIISKQAGSGNTQQGFNVEDFPNNETSLTVSNGGGNFGGDSSGVATISTYHHYVFIYSNGTSKCYFDNVLINTTTGQTATIGSNTMDLLIGKANWIYVNTVDFNGVLDNVRIYNRELSACDVDSLFNMPNPLSTGITVNNINENISIYPNPATTLLSIHQSMTTPNEQLIITDIMGTEVYKEKLTGISTTISISTWSAGIYFYEVSQNSSTRGKFVVQK